MPKASKSQVYAIQWLVQQNKSNEEIASELNITLKQVNSIIEDNNIEKRAQAPQQEETVSAPTIKDVMINQTAVKRTNSVAIMTKEASEIADEARKRMPINSIDQQKGIFRPNSK